MGTFDLSVRSLPLSPAATDEFSVLERVQEGDVDALAEVYDRHHAALCAFARRLLSDDAAAEDLVHDVFVVLPKVVHRVEPGRSLRSFLIGVAANRAKHHLRARARYGKMTDRFAVEPVSAAESPEQHAERSALARTLARALDVLSLDQRVTFVLCEIEGETSGACGRILGIPEGTVRTRLFSARKKLREHLASEGIR